MGKLVTDETLKLLVEAVKNSATVTAQKEEIQTEGDKQLKAILAASQEILKVKGELQSQIDEKAVGVGVVFRVSENNGLQIFYKK